MRRLPPLAVAIVWNWVRWAFTLVSEMSGAARAGAAAAAAAAGPATQAGEDGGDRGGGEQG